MADDANVELNKEQPRLRFNTNDSDKHNHHRALSNLISLVFFLFLVISEQIF